MSAETKPQIAPKCCDSNLGEPRILGSGEVFQVQVQFVRTCPLPGNDCTTFRMRPAAWLLGNDGQNQSSAF